MARWTPQSIPESASTWPLESSASNRTVDVVHARTGTNFWPLYSIFCAKATKFEREAEIEFLNHAGGHLIRGEH